MTDITGPHGSEGNQSLLSRMVHFTKWPEAILLRDQEASTIAREYIKIFARHGEYNTLLSDQAHNFMPTLVREVCQFLRVRKMFTTPYHPEWNGQVENFRKTLKNGLECELHGWSKTWDQHMEYILTSDSGR
jgi:hypothetical protein